MVFKEKLPPSIATFFFPGAGYRTKKNKYYLQRQPALRTIKTHLRSTMGQSRLSDLATIMIHDNCVVDLDRVVDIFNNKSRRLIL